MHANQSATSLSLLERAKGGDQAAWATMAELYAPLVHRWLKKYGLQDEDSADVLQHVFTTVSQKLSDFRKEQPDSSFRGWIFSITRTKAVDFFRAQKQQPVGQGGTDAQAKIEQIRAEEESSAHELRNETAELYQRALQLIQSDFSDNVIRAFFRHAIDGVPAAEVAEELGMTRDAVYAAKKRILKRLREELAGLL